MQTEIRPCCFCGSTEIEVQVIEGRVWVGCNKCEARGPTARALLWELHQLQPEQYHQKIDLLVEEAIKLWNKSIKSL